MGFRQDGSWWPDGVGDHAVNRLVRVLVGKRLSGAGFSPRDAAEMVRGSSVPFAFSAPCMAIWEALEKPDSWRLAPTARSAEEAVKRAGRENHLPGHWEGHRWEAPTATAYGGPRQPGESPQIDAARAHGWD